MAKRVVVVGGGAAGITAARTAREEGAEVTLVTAEEHVAYSPCALPFVLAGELDLDDVVMRTPEHYERMGIEVLTGTEVVEVDTDAKVVETEDGDNIEYDSLVLATGGEPLVPPIDGVDLEGVFTLRRLEDVPPLMEAVEDAERAAVVGAGPIGVEVADALSRRLERVYLIEMLDRVLPQMLDGETASFLEETMTKRGVTPLLGEPLEAIRGDDAVEEVVVGGDSFEVDIVVMAVGVAPNLELFDAIGAETLPFGVLTDPALRVKSEDGGVFGDVFAAGDCVADRCAVTGEPVPSQLGTVAVRQGRIAGLNAASDEPRARWNGTLNTAVVVAFGLEAASTGLTEARAGELGVPVVSATVESTTRARYYPGGEPLVAKLIAEEGSGRIVGCQVVAGERARERVDGIALAVRSGATVWDLIDWDFSYSPPVGRVVEPLHEAAIELAGELRS
ncbi:MAG: FAD-dependent oxidoreductase [Methanopyri archaeon]|nr:FAD-dependent oxidoreductase [Methanopyri archaeon]